MTDMKPSCPWWKSPKGIAALIALAALGLYLIIVHQQHVLGALPFLLKQGLAFPTAIAASIAAMAALYGGGIWLYKTIL